MFPQLQLRCTTVLATLLGSATASATEPRFAPERPRVGDLALVFLDAGDDPLTGTGTISAFGYYFELVPSEGGRWRGAVAVPVDIEPGPWPVVVERSGRRWVTELSIDGRSFRRSELSVQKRFTTKKRPKELEQRIRKESEAWQRMLDAGSRTTSAFQTPVRPAAGARTSEFGVQRVLNGVVESQHYGLDLDGKVGDPAVALQSGVVSLSSDRFYSGGTIVLHHGHGLYSAYFHLSKRLLKVGARASAGDKVGAVGRTGRVTGPHLHLALFVRARGRDGSGVRGLYVDPEPWIEAAWKPAGRP